MLSKWKIWDFEKSYINGLNPSQKGIIAFHSFDPIINSLIKSKFPKSYFEGESLHTFQGKEIHTNWLEDNFKSLGLFGNSDSFCITKAEELSSECKDLLLEDDLILENRYLILFFEKNDDFFKKLSKKDSIQAFKIDAPAFWENDKLLDYFAKERMVQLSFEAKQTILNYVEPTCINLYNLMSKLSLNFTNEQVSNSMLDEVIEKSKLDHFEMASLFGFKQMNEFYSKIISLDPDYNALRSLFYFLQTHMIKIADPSFIDKKPKPTKYDNQIISQSRIWKKNELTLVVSFLRDLEFKAKIKNPYVKVDIKSAYYRSM